MFKLAISACSQAFVFLFLSLVAIPAYAGIKVDSKVTVVNVAIDSTRVPMAARQTALSIADIYPGDHVTLEQVRQAALNVRRFFALQRVEVDTVFVTEGVRLTFHLIPSETVGRVFLTDKGGKSMDWLPLDQESVGKKWSATLQKKILRDAELLVQRYDPGIWKFRLRKVQDFSASGRVAIQVQVDTLVRKKPLYLQHCPVTLLKVLENHLYDREQIRTKIESFLKTQRSSGHWAAHLTTTTKGTPDRVSVRCYERNLGRRYRFMVEGSRYLDASEVRFILQPDPTVEFQAIDLSGMRGKLIERYQREGFFDARVEIKAMNREDETVVYVRIDEGILRTLKQIRLEGLPSRERITLLALLPLTVSRFQQLTSDRSRIVTHKRLEETRSIVENFLFDQGWLEGKLENFVLSRTGRDFRLAITVSTGPRYRYGPAEGLARLPGVVPEPPEPGSLFTRESWEKWRQDVQDRLSRFGYLVSTLRLDTEVDARSKSVIPVVVGDAGETFVVGRIYIQGIEAGDAAALRKILPLKSGDIAAESQLVEVRRRYYLLGLFSSVQVDWFRLDNQERTADLLVRLRKKAAGEIRLGIGVNTAEGVEATFHLVHRNLLGSLRNLELDGRLQYGYDAIFRRPALDNPLRAEMQASLYERWLLGTSLRGRLTGSWKFDFTQSDYDYSILEGVIGADYGEIATTLHYLFYSLQRVNKFNILNRQIDPERMERIGKIVYDYSHSTLDNRFDPRAGGYWSAEGGLSQPWLGSMYKYLRFELNGRYLYKVLPQLTLVISAKGGALLPLEKRSYFPRSEKFKLGGVGSVRGYQTDVIGPATDAGLPVGTFVNVGGLRSFDYQAEVRIPFTGKFDLALFQDSGVVWGTEKDNSVGSGASIGTGVLYHSPIGPIRLDFGKKLLVNEIDKTSYALHFYIGALL